MEEAGIEAAETVPASRKLGGDHAKELVRAAARVYIAKGKKLDVFDGGTASDEIVTKMLGSTGNLRAPTIVAGDQLLVGFHEETYRQILG